jgi:hypothetical protein
MTRLEAMLERAAEAQPITFGTDDVRRRVRRRRRSRRAAAGVAAVLVVVAGLVTLAGASRDDHVATVGETDDVSVVGHWDAVTVDGVDATDHLRLALHQIDAEIQRQQGVLDHLGGPDEHAARTAAQQVLTQLFAKRADLETSPPMEVELRGDGTFDGHEVFCGELAGHWRLDDDRLIVDMAKGTTCAPGDHPTTLSTVLRAEPTVRAGADPGTLELSSSDHSATLRPMR